MLTAYQNETTRLLQYPAAPTSLYTTTDITTWINSARQQLAAEGQCIRVYCSLNIASSTNSYAFSAITIPSGQGYNNVLHIRQATLAGGGMLNPWPFEYFNRFFLSPELSEGTPTDWAQYGQGSNGTIYLNPPPNASGSLNLDTVMLPITLTTDADPEAIPYPWTDAVPYFAAYLALLSAQTQARQADAQRMFDRYTEFVNRARRFSNPDVLNFQYPQSGVVMPIPPGGNMPRGAARNA